ncbi:hypothetical protein N7468_010163 [Penicillium chermesinum]|uniref:Thiol methyltransferase n=1 Tax=Penicillium chermesinum TaxID=63820 RepID=A0A9W9NC52_9EURO|nr:uncharacterized protein N7468_010163 [Penicillium chermesinum]KAJ5217155.1 hypothetical protein N7468_010163 [Penicillium chermesinum]
MPASTPVPTNLAAFQGDKYADAWAAQWKKGESLPWDEGFPNPALEDALVNHKATIGEAIGHDAQGQPYRRKALVPGCGRGVDVLLLASFGFDAYGLEYSPDAIEACKKEEKENHSWYRARDQAVGPGKVNWFFCALSPSMRPRWALRQTQLLAPSPSGNLICLEFPRHKSPSEAGPPWASPSEAYMEHLSHPGEEVHYNDQGLVKENPLQPPSKAGLERVAFWQPERTHEKGQGKDGVIHDRVSIWRRRN